MNDLGFQWNVRHRLNSFDILNILILYKDIHGNLNIPTSYKIPSIEPWPASLHGWKLGQRIAHIRNRGDYKEIREDLDLLCFPWDSWRDKKFQEILEALAEFKKNSMSKSRFTSIGDNYD